MKKEEFITKAIEAGFTENQAEFLWMLNEKIRMAGLGFGDLS